MPGFDRTGPQGQGPMTGRRMGRCNPETQPKDSDTPANNAEEFKDKGWFGYGRGFGRGRGMGRGFRHGFGGRGFGRGGW